MKSTFKVLGIVAIAAVIGFSMTGCDRNEDSSAAGTTPAATPNYAATPTPAAVDPASIDNWDTFLVEYERFMLNEYIPMAKRLAEGDMTVMVEFQEIRNRIAAWYQRMQVFALTAGEPTEAQQAKLDDIERRISAALED